MSVENYDDLIDGYDDVEAKDSPESEPFPKGWYNV